MNHSLGQLVVQVALLEDETALLGVGTEGVGGIKSGEYAEAAVLVGSTAGTVSSCIWVVGLGLCSYEKTGS